MNPDLRATYLANRADAAELLGELYMTSWDRAASVREKERLANAALLAVEAGRQRALEDFRSLADRSDAQEASELSALDAQLSAKRHRLATLLDQQNPPIDMIAQLRGEISLLRTQIDIAESKGPDGRPASAARLPGSVAEVQRTLQPRETVLVYQLGPHRSRLWAVTHEAIAVATLDGRAQIEDAARELYRMWSTPAPVDSQRELAASRVILGDKPSWLHPGDRIVVVADGTLRSLPFGALPIAGADGALRRIATTNEVSFRPTVRSSGSSVRTGAATPANRILLVGDPTAPQRPHSATSALVVDPWALPPLPGSRREIQEIAAIAADWRSYVLLGAEATKPALLSMPLDSFRAIHFATHARLDIQDPELSSIALSTGKKALRLRARC